MEFSLSLLPTLARLILYSANINRLEHALYVLDVTSDTDPGGGEFTYRRGAGGEEGTVYSQRLIACG